MLEDLYDVIETYIYDYQTPLLIVVILIAIMVLIVLLRWQLGRIMRHKVYLCIDDFIRQCHEQTFYAPTHAGYKEFTSLYKKLHRTWYYKKSDKLFIRDFIKWFETADTFIKRMSAFMHDNHYFAHSEFLSCIKNLDISETTKPFLSNEFICYINKSNPNSLSSVDKYKEEIERGFTDVPQEHNVIFVKKELELNKTYFDTVLKYPLDQQQRESIVKLEDNCLVISSAGSGKTSTSIAKVKYLLKKRLYRKEEILVVSYNRKTAEEFQERLGIQGLTCKTFHALALSIIGKVEGERPDVCEPTFLLTCYYNLIKKDSAFKTAINKFVSEVSSLTRGEHEYTSAEEYFKDREIYGIMAPYGDMNGSPIFTRSEEEKKICTWLSSHDVKFLYEKPYPFPTANTNHRQYKPDFTIYFNKDGKEYYLFLEHFGIDKDGNVPLWFGDGAGGFDYANQKYNSDILWKRQLHRQNNTLLIETTSAMFHDKTVYDKLEKQLRDVGVPIRELSEDEKYERLIERNRTIEKSIMELFSSFINLMKSSGKSFDIVMEDIKKSNKGDAFNERCRYLMYEVIKPLYNEYERALKSRGQMDFTDLVIHATELCNSDKYISPYRYILVDEFQDISIDRYKFILSLRGNPILTKTYCVGDDWQSIYRFSGSDMSLFNHFEKYFGFTERCKIETTYRFGNPLINKSSLFILRNPNQIKKKVRPLSEEMSTKISFEPFTRGQNSFDYLETIKRVLDGIPSEETVMLLARYNHEVRVFPRNAIAQNPNTQRAIVTFAGRTMNFMSVHAAKGLEADNVLILNCSQDGGGFPSRITDDPILGYVLSDIDTFEYSEERRLFYVAITRARKHTFVLYNAEMPSIFVTEMEECENGENMSCPRCKKGRLKIITEGIYHGHPYRNYVCTNSIAGCSFFWQVYYDNVNDIFIRYHNEMDRYFR